MDWLHYGILLWITVALLFVGLGTMLTVIARRKQEPHAPRGATHHSSDKHISSCPACGKQTDDPGAHWCGFCGQPLRGRICRRGEEEAQKKRLVDIRTIDREIQQAVQARIHDQIRNKL